MTGPLTTIPTDRPDAGLSDLLGQAPFLATLTSIVSRQAAGNESYTAAAVCISAHTNAPGVRIWSYSSSVNRLKLRAVVGIDVPFEGLQDDVPVENSELGSVVLQGTPYLVHLDESSIPWDVQCWANRSRVRSILVLPIRALGKIWGVLGIFSQQRLSEEQKADLESAAEAIGSALSTTGNDHSSSDTALLPSLLPCLQSAIVTLDDSGKVISWNRRAESLFGWSEDQILGNPLPVVPLKDRYETTNPAGSPPSLNVSRYQTVCQRADLSTVHVIRTSGPLFDSHGVPVGSIEVFDDDSQRIQMSRCLDVQGQVARILTGCRGPDDGLPGMLAAMGKWLGAESAEFWARDIEHSLLVRKYVWADTLELQDRLSATERRVKADSADWPARIRTQGQFTFEKSPGDVQFHSHNLSSAAGRTDVPRLGLPVYADGQHLAVIALSGESLAEPDELTTRTLRFCADTLGQFLARLQVQESLAKSEAKLRQSQKMDAIGLLAGGVAHDFNNLLTIILSYSEMGLDEVDESHPLHELFTEIHGAGERAARMTSQLLAVSRQQPSRAVLCSLNELIREMDRMFQRLLGPEISLVVEKSEDLWNVNVDRNQMEQVLLNLVVNARDAMVSGGTITVRTRNLTQVHGELLKHQSRHTSFVELSVTDTGCGMDDATKGRIFEPFFTTKEVGKGTGMGLSTVFGIVQQCEGLIEVESKLGEGTTFSILLPKADPKLATQVIAERPDQIPNGHETILIVDGDHALRSLLHRLLAVRGYTVLEADNSRDALKLLASRWKPVDLVLTDLQLPGEGGRSFIELLNTLKKRPRILLMSGRGEQSPQSGQAAVIPVLPKPFTSAELARNVRAAIDLV